MISSGPKRIILVYDYKFVTSVSFASVLPKVYKRFKRKIIDLASQQLSVYTSLTSH